MARYTTTVLLVLGFQAAAFANAILFTGTTQSASEILTTGGPGAYRRGTVLGNAATLEAWFCLNPNTPALGAIYTEHDFAREDKTLLVGPNRIQSFFAIPGFSGNAFDITVPISIGQWHHVAHVYDGAKVSLYLDGLRIGELLANGDIGDYPRPQDMGGIGTLELGGFVGFGSYRREGDNRTDPAILGYVDAFRISNFARYSGNTFTPLFDNLPNDAGTAVSFNFDEPIGTGTRDLQGIGGAPLFVRTGVLQSGTTPTGGNLIVPAPSIVVTPLHVPEPSCVFMCLIGSLMVFVRKRNRALT